MKLKDEEEIGIELYQSALHIAVTFRGKVKDAVPLALRKLDRCNSIGFTKAYVCAIRDNVLVCGVMITNPTHETLLAGLDELADKLADKLYKPKEA